jgi:hypothetical protein
MMRIGIALGVLVALADARSACAQVPAEFGALKPRQLVRVRPIAQPRIETQLGDSVTTLFTGATPPFEAGDVDTLWVRGRATATGAIVGAAVATPLSFLFRGWVREAVAGRCPSRRSWPRAGSGWRCDSDGLAAVPGALVSLYSAMPIRARVQRLWRLVVEWWRPSIRRPSQPQASRPHAPPPPQPRLRIASGHPAKAPAAPHVGEPLVGGAVTVRMWVVAGRVVLATSEAEAERALVTLLGELAPDEQPVARALADALRGDGVLAAA